MIEFDGVNKAFAGEPAVKNLNLHLREGAFSGADWHLRLGEVDHAEDD